MTALLAETVCRTLEEGNSLVLATIIGSQGSTPRTPGTKMLVFANREITGTIGGGLLESQVIDRSVLALDQGAPAFMSFDLTHELAATMDMICGGSLDVFLDLLRPDEATRAVFENWRRALSLGRAGFLLTSIERDQGQPGRVRHGFLDESGDITGRIGVPAEIMAAAGQKKDGTKGLRIMDREGTILLLEPVEKANAAYIIGAGHVAMFTARLAAMTGFRVAVMDDRAEFANRGRFPEAAEVRIVDDYHRCLNESEVDEDAFVIIVTRGHLHDKEALAQALRTRAGYVGMIGSRRKRNAIYNALLQEGFTSEDINRVHSPIGLSIDAETPEEIAVSIAAEMIQVRANLGK